MYHLQPTGNRLFQDACAATDFRINEICPLVNASGRNSSPIFTKFGIWLAEVIFKAELVYHKRKYFARMRGCRISVFLSHFQYFTSKNHIFTKSSPYLA